MQVARAGGLAHWLVARSTLHPMQRDLPVMHELSLGGNSTAPKFERHTARLTRAAYANALKLAWCVDVQLRMYMCMSVAVAVVLRRTGFFFWLQCCLG